MKTEDGVKYITQIDDYKRELLMRVRDRIENSEKFEEQYGTRFICCAMKYILCEEEVVDFLEDSTSLAELVDEIFPEFIAMFDGVCWCEDSVYYEITSNQGWWEIDWKEPRIRILDTILQTW